MLLAGARLAWFGSPLPRPVTSKASELSIEGGLEYLRSWGVSRDHLPIGVVAVVGAVVALRAVTQP